jgi:hypothetical protein
LSDDLRRFFERMAEEPRTAPGVPPAMLRRAARRRVRTVLILGLAAALVGYGGFAGVRAIVRPSQQFLAAQGQCSWDAVPSPNQEPDRLANDLRAVIALSDDDVWAVGESYVNQEAGETFPLAMHWDGSAWSIVSIPSSFGHAGLLDVDGTSSADVWAIGLGGKALHWDGSRWTTVPLADPGTHYWHVESLSAVAPDDAWAVGGTATGSSGGSLVEHWDGSTWSVVEAPSPPPDPLTADAYPSLSAVDALGPADAWATGQTENVAPVGQSNTVALHWDGSSWTRTETPEVAAQDGTYGHLLGVSATGPDDVWAVGIAASAPGIFGGGDRALIEHWNGTSWTVGETLPADSRLVRVVAIASDDAWAVGSTGYSGTFRPLVLRWDGSRWNEIPVNVEGQASLSDISMSPSGDLWAVGDVEENGHGRTLTLRCPGS